MKSGLQAERKECLPLQEYNSTVLEVSHSGWYDFHTVRGNLVTERKLEEIVSFNRHQAPLWNRTSMAVSTEMLSLKQQFEIQEFDNWTQIDLWRSHHG